MAAQELRIGNQAAYFRKAISTPTFDSESVLTRDAFLYAKLWLKRNCKEAIPYWTQAENYFQASKILPVESAPLTSYYCFLNAAKALLVVKGKPFTDRHGVSGEQIPESKRALSNETITIQKSGVLSSLASYLNEPEEDAAHSLSDLLGNLPFIHRAYRHTFKSKQELFIPVRNLVYRKHPSDNRIWVTADVTGRFADGRTMKTLPNHLERDLGYSEEEYVIRPRRRKRWYSRGDNEVQKQAAFQRLNSMHRKLRLDFCYISAPLSLWYLKRRVNSTKAIRRYGMTIIMAAMHRLSELSRYDPGGLNSYFDGQANWLLTELIELGPQQFIDELVCEMT
ncbi:YaaC family protein, partial [Marinobacter sp.]|uniref:YaaC family protein n=1 Tax=Marinobacter sp. TaxID=50741 RepID=UPI00329A71E5